MSLSVGLIGLVAVILLWALEFRDRRTRTQQLRILAKHARALEELMKAQSDVLNGLTEKEPKAAPDWFSEAERRRQVAESDPALAVWGELEDLVDSK